MTLIDLESLAKTWHGRADPIEDIARLYAGLARHGVLANLPDSAIKRSQESLLRGYLIERGETYSSVKSTFDFYVARYIGVLLRRNSSGMSVMQERRLLGQIMPIAELPNGVMEKIKAIWSLEAKSLDDVELPELAVSIKIGRESAENLYLLARKSWEDSFDPELFQEILKKVRKDRTLNESELNVLKSVRKQSRWVRTSFLALDSQHEVPNDIHHFVKILGDLCDALENKVNDGVGSLANELLKSTRQRAFERSLNQFRPSSESGISAYVELSFKNILSLVDKKSLSLQAFPELRKDISRLQQVLKLVYISNPTTELELVMDYVNVVNRITRKVHDSFVSQSLKGKIVYEKAKVKMPPDLPEAIKSVLERIQYGKKGEVDSTSVLNRLEDLLNSAYEETDAFDIPQSIAISLTRKDAKEMFDVALQYWKQTFNRDQVISGLKEVIANKYHSELVSADQRAYLKSLRKKAMVLRYLFLSLDISHQTPKALESFIVGMGKMNDSLANGTTHAADLAEQILRQLDSQEKGKKFAWNVDPLALSIKKFKADSSEGIHKNLQNLIQQLQKRIRSTLMSAKFFHKIRKETRQLQGVLRLVQVVEPSEHLQEIIDRLHKLNEKTGKIHDEVVANTFNETVDYNSVPIEMPPELAYELDRIIGLIKF